MPFRETRAFERGFAENPVETVKNPRVLMILSANAAKKSTRNESLSVVPRIVIACTVSESERIRGMFGKTPAL